MQVDGLPSRTYFPNIRNIAAWVLVIGKSGTCTLKCAYAIPPPCNIFLFLFAYYHKEIPITMALFDKP